MTELRDGITSLHGIHVLIYFRYSNIFITAPSPENLKTMFEFVFKGFDALEYQEHLDYELIQSTNPEFNKAIVRVNIFREHRQTIQVITDVICNIVILACHPT